MGKITGIGVSGDNIRPVQRGAPAIITVAFNPVPGPTGGYGWAKNILDITGGSSGIPGIITDPIPQTGFNAFTCDNNTTLTVGTKGWLEEDRQAAGYEFIPAAVNTSTAFPARLTSGYTGSTGYNWQALVLQITPSRKYVLATLTGTNAVEVGGNVNLQAGRNAIFYPDPTTAGCWMFELWPLPIVGEVCPQFTSGVLTGITVQQITDGSGTPACNSNPQDCCDPLTVTCGAECPGVALPNQVWLTFAGYTDTNFPGPPPNGIKWSCLNGIIIPLNWSTIYLAWESALIDFNITYPLGVGTPCVPVVVTSTGMETGLTLMLGCPGGTSALQMTAGTGIGFGITSIGSMTLVSCDPFQVVFADVVLNFNGVTSNAGTITITGP